jgi:pSer/pThr/pTyr-binding forkhead associated (FHA) protein
MRLTVYFPEDSPTTHEFVGQKLTVGRLGDNDVQVEDASVSSHHGEIELGEGSAVLRDLGSTNGTFLNGEQVTGEHSLAEGDEIYFGSVRTVFMEPVASAEQALEAPPPVEDAATMDASGGGRPDNFHYMSPLARPQPSKDVLGVAAWVSAGLGVLAACYALFVIFVG